MLLPWFLGLVEAGFGRLAWFFICISLVLLNAFNSISMEGPGISLAASLAFAGLSMVLLGIGAKGFISISMVYICLYLAHFIRFSIVYII